MLLADGHSKIAVPTLLLPPAFLPPPPRTLPLPFQSVQSKAADLNLQSDVSCE